MKKKEKRTRRQRARAFAAFALVLVMAAGLVGCESAEKEGGLPGIQGGGADGTAGKPGRYVERELTLPEGLEAGGIFQIENDKNTLCVYATGRREDGSFGIARYLYEDGRFEESTPKWLAEANLIGELSPEDIVWEEIYWPEMKVMEGGNGGSYLFYSLYDEEAGGMPGYLFLSTDGETAREITPKDWKEKDPELNHVYGPRDVTILSDGSVAANFGFEISVYDGGTMEKIAEKQMRENYREELYACGDEYYLLKEGYTGSGIVLTGIDVFDKNGAEAVRTIACRESVGENTRLDFLPDRTPVLCGENGIFTYDAQADKWEQIVDGVYTSLSVGSMWCTGFAAADNGAYYAKINRDDGGVMLAEYVYDESAEGPSEELRIYTLYENATLKNIAALYTREHPETKVTVEVGISFSEAKTADEKDAIQSFNARLLSGDTPDLVLLDGMRGDSFVEKGLLSDISDIVTPMSQKGEILGNIAAAYTEKDGSVYRIPLKFSVTFLLGKSIDAGKNGSVDALAQTVSKMGTPVFGRMTLDDFVDTFVPYLLPELVQDKKLSREALTRDLESLRLLASNGGIVDRYEETRERMWDVWDLPSVAGAAFCETNGFLNAMYPVAVKKLVNGSICCFDNAFVPVGEIGIMSTSAKQESAKKFLTYALSAKALDGDFYDGFAINAEALENQAKKDRSNYCAATEIEGEGGQWVLFEIDALTEAEAMEIVELCRKLDHPVVKDAEVLAAIRDALPAYLKGETSPEDTVTKIERSLSMYLAE